MDNILKPIVLKLNAAWQHTAQCSIKKAIIGMCDDSTESGVLGMNIEYELDSISGEFNFDAPSNLYPVKWADWIDLPIRPYDMTVQGASRVIRAPTVIIAVNYHRMPLVRKSPSKMGIFERDGGICQYTNKPLTRKSANVDHVIPKDRWKEVRGDSEGLDSWENLVLCDKNLNSRKGNKLNEEIGLKLIRKPASPPSLPASAYIREAKQRDWNIFLHK